MHIESVSNQGQDAFKSMAHKKAEEHPKKSHAKIQRPTDITHETTSEEPHEHDDQQRGVIRLLEEGHFKGVADVRLRINFFDELASQANSQAIDSLPSQTQLLTDQVSAEFANVLGTMGFDEQTTTAANQLLEDFKTAGQKAAGEAAADGKLDSEVLQTKLREAFDTLVNGLSSLTPQPLPQPEAPPATPEQTPVPDASAPPVAEDPGEQSPAVDLMVEPSTVDVALPTPSTDQIPASESPTDVPVEPPQTDVAEVDPFASLTQVFDSAIATLNQSLAAIIRLPDPSPPSGHGSAYDKFLAIYNAMRDGSTTNEEDQAPPNVEVSA